MQILLIAQLSVLDQVTIILAVAIESRVRCIVSTCSSVNITKKEKDLKTAFFD